MRSQKIKASLGEGRSTRIPHPMKPDRPRQFVIRASAPHYPERVFEQPQALTAQARNMARDIANDARNIASTGFFLERGMIVPICSDGSRIPVEPFVRSVEDRLGGRYTVEVLPANGGIVIRRKEPNSASTTNEFNAFGDSIVSAKVHRGGKLGVRISLFAAMTAVVGTLVFSAPEQKAYAQTASPPAIHAVYVSAAATAAAPEVGVVQKEPREKIEPIISEEEMKICEINPHGMQLAPKVAERYRSMVGGYLDRLSRHISAMITAYKRGPQTYEQYVKLYHDVASYNNKFERLIGAYARFGDYINWYERREGLTWNPVDWREVNHEYLRHRWMCTWDVSLPPDAVDGVLRSSLLGVELWRYTSRALMREADVLRDILAKLTAMQREVERAYRVYSFGDGTHSFDNYQNAVKEVRRIEEIKRQLIWRLSAVYDELCSGREWRRYFRPYRSDYGSLMHDYAYRWSTVWSPEEGIRAQTQEGRTLPKTPGEMRNERINPPPREEATWMDLEQATAIMGCGVRRALAFNSELKTTPDGKAIQRIPTSVTVEMKSGAIVNAAFLGGCEGKSIYDTPTYRIRITAGRREYEIVLPIDILGINMYGPSDKAALRFVESLTAAMIEASNSGR
ncbi:MAG: hypothetical protein QXP42_05455 [Candidatus Micrarchaeia archaeon]